MAQTECKFYPTVGEFPLQEYPRPQFARTDWICLNGKYEFAITGSKDRPAAFDSEILVPFSPEYRLSGVEKHPIADDQMWYRRTFTVPAAWSGKRVILNFGAVDYTCEVFVNGLSVGTHTGGYLPFGFDITDFLADGENELVVRANDPTDRGGQPRGKQATNSHGFWYKANSGIWQTVWLEPVSAAHLECVKMTPDIYSQTLTVAAQIPAGCELSAVITDAEGNSVADAVLTGEDTLPVKSPRLWSPEDPYLYNIVFTLKQDGAVVDTVSSYFGMRDYALKKDIHGFMRLCLNGKPYFQSGLLDQGYWFDSGLTPPTEEAMVYDIQKMKDMGFNMLRKHIKVEPLRWYYLCDKMGMLVWQDMVSGGPYESNILVGVLPNMNIRRIDDTAKNYKLFKRDNAEDRAEFKRELNEMIDVLYNSTSICCWVPFNEGWGQFDALEVGLWTKEKDPSRFVDHASGWHDQGGPDFVSIHKYVLPVRAPKQDPNRPFVLSEFGGYSLILDEHVWNKKKSFGYMMYKSQESLTAAVKKLYEKQIIPLLKKGLSATVYTQVSDVEAEVNGLLTYDRKIVKVDEQTMREINAKLKY
ncbi:MAG: glycoside hydrolase family 2 [Clostridia bacterium]|nr:glycoside hydrolase family 2 [Clostridia bacterium]